ncbi:MAG TPA: hypothetical protein VGE09_08460 [Pseudoxanthomonas sp.]
MVPPFKIGQCMTSKEELLQIADRCEREGPSFDLDCKIERLCEPHRAKQICNARPYTTSLDAAVTLYKTKPDRISTDPMKVCAEALRQWT